MAKYIAVIAKIPYIKRLKKATKKLFVKMYPIEKQNNWNEG